MNAGAPTATVRQAACQSDDSDQFLKRSTKYTDTSARVVSLFSAPTSSTAATSDDEPSRIAQSAATVVASSSAKLSCKSFMNENGSVAASSVTAANASSRENHRRR